MPINFDFPRPSPPMNIIIVDLPVNAGGHFNESGYRAVLTDAVLPMFKF